MNKLEKELIKVRSDKQKDFLAKLVPTIDKEKILGVKNPQAREIAKRMYKEDKNECLEYLKILPHKYLEEYILHTSILEQIKDYDFVVKEIEKVLPYIDNWATCDTYSPKIVKKHLKDFYKYICKWIKSKNTYTVRFGIEMLMSFYLDDVDRINKNIEDELNFNKKIEKRKKHNKCFELQNDIQKKECEKISKKNFEDEYLNYEEKNKDVVKVIEMISNIRFKSKYKYLKESQSECPDKYYVDMMIAWFFATLLAKNYEIGLYYIKNKKLEKCTHNMTIKKAKESYRISDEQKAELEKYKEV